MKRSQSVGQWSVVGGFVCHFFRRSCECFEAGFEEELNEVEQKVTKRRPHAPSDVALLSEEVSLNSAPSAKKLQRPFLNSMETNE